TGKTYSMAKVIEETQRPALIMAPNKILTAQLASEFREFFPDAAVEFFTGKTYSMAKVIEETQRPALIMAPNKILTAQLA
ncbi:hypothetical protein CTI14_68260, partial [Methylobacterium radiotolerans]